MIGIVNLQFSCESHIDQKVNLQNLPLFLIIIHLYFEGLGFNEIF